MSKETFNPINYILNNLSYRMTKVAESEIRAVVENILEAERIFLADADRSGLIIEIFAMRLTHPGLDAEVVGYPVTPAAKRET